MHRPRVSFTTARRMPSSSSSDLGMQSQKKSRTRSGSEQGSGQKKPPSERVMPQPERSRRSASSAMAPRHGPPPIPNLIHRTTAMSHPFPWHLQPIRVAHPGPGHPVPRPSVDHWRPRFSSIHTPAAAGAGTRTTFSPHSPEPVRRQGMSSWGGGEPRSPGRWHRLSRGLCGERGRGGREGGAASEQRILDLARGSCGLRPRTAMSGSSGIRTLDRRIKSPLLYLAELRTRRAV